MFSRYCVGVVPVRSRKCRVKEEGLAKPQFNAMSVTGVSVRVSCLAAIRRRLWRTYAIGVELRYL